MKRSNDAGLCPPMLDSDNKDERPIPDTLNQKGAMALAKRLEKYWHDKGYHAARFWAELIDERFAKVGTYEIYRVACNLIDGLPPRYRDDLPTAAVGPPPPEQ